MSKKQVLFKGYDEENECWRFGYYYKGTLSETDTPLCLDDCRIKKVIITDEGTFYHCKPDSIQQLVREVHDEKVWEYVE